MTNYSKVSNELLDAVGGKDNVISVTHCATRLRLVLKDKNKYDAKTIDKIDGVQGLFFNSGQLQIIFGLNVPEYYKSFLEVSGIAESKIEKPKTKQNWFMSILKVFPGTIMPLLSTMVGCAMITAIITIIDVICSQGFGLNITTNNWYKLFKEVGVLVTNFLVVFICVSAAKYWNVNIYNALAIGLFLASGPVLGTLIPGWAYYNKSMINQLPYATSIFAGLITVRFAAMIERSLNKRVNDNLKMFVVSTSSVTLSIVFCLLLFGPLMAYLEKGLGIVSEYVTHKNAYGLGIAFMSMIFAPLVITGVHQALVPVILTNMYKNGFDMLALVMLSSNLAQGMAAIVVAIRTKDKKLKTLGYSSGAVALMGITEPAMFGVNMRNKKAFISAMLGAFVGGFVMGITGTAIFVGVGSPGLLYFLGAIRPDFVQFPIDNFPWLANFTMMNVVWLIVGMVATMASTFIIAFFYLKKEPNPNSKFAQKIKEMKVKIAQFNKKIHGLKAVQLLSKAYTKLYFLCHLDEKKEHDYELLDKLGGLNTVAKGEVLPLSQAQDNIFASGSMGPGYVINPIEGKIYSPFNGEVTMIFETKHAIGLKSNDGIEVLIHVGIDTVQLDGKYFKTKIKVGDKVKVGQDMLHFNLEKIKEQGYSSQIFVVITNYQEFKEIKINESEMRQGFNHEIIHVS